MSNIRAEWLDFIARISSGYRYLGVGHGLVAVVKAYAASLVAR